MNAVPTRFPPSPKPRIPCLCLLGIATILAGCGENQEPPPAANAQRMTVRRGPQPGAAGLRLDATPAPANAPEDSETAPVANAHAEPKPKTPTGEAGNSADDPEGSAGTLVLNVMNGATGAPLEGAFQWTFVPGLPRPGASNVAKQPGADSSDQNPGSLRGDSVSATPAAAPKGGKRSGPGENGTAEFPMPRDEFGTLTVEAADFQPFVRTAVRLPYGVDRHELPVLLDPIAKATGIELQVTGPDGTPISAVQVRAEQPNVVGQGFHLAWQRRNQAANGIYPLPDLPPGSYRFSLEATTAGTPPVRLFAVTRLVHFTGNEQIPLAVTMQRGAVITVTVTDDQGTNLGAAVQLELIDESSKVLPTAWTQLAPNGTEQSRPGGPPGDGPATLKDAVAPGAYTLRIQSPGFKPLEVPIQLGTGASLQQQIVLTPAGG